MADLKVGYRTGFYVGEEMGPCYSVKETYNEAGR